MASKKILLEVLTTDRNRVAPAPPRTKKEKEERRREKPPRSSRPLSLPHPTTQGLLLVLACVVAIVVSYAVGFRVGRSADSTPPDLSTSAKVSDLLGPVPDERPPAPAVGETGSRAPAATSRWVVQLVSYDRSPRNEDLAKRTRDELQKLGLPDVEAFDFRGKFIVTAGSFPSKEDAALGALLQRVKGMPFGTEKTPFAEARIRELQ